MAWYGLAYARIYEVIGQKKFLSLSKQIFDWVWKEEWDTDVCGGGVWCDQTHGGNQTIENVQMFQLGNKLARLFNKAEYSEKANTSGSGSTRSTSST